MPRPDSFETVRQSIAQARALAHRRARDRTGLYWIEGIRGFIQACDTGHEFAAILHSPILLKNDLAEMLARKLAARGVRRVRLTPEQFRSVSRAPRASGIGALVKQRWLPLEQAGPQRGLAWLVIEHLRSAGNLGTILRTAEATGVGGVILLSKSLDPFDPAVLRASMGGILHIPLFRATHAAVRRWAQKRDVALIGLSPDGPALWTELPAFGRIALIIGEERRGLSAAARRLCHLRARLPMTGRADSLNVAVATGVMLYELLRRKCCV